MAAISKGAVLLDAGRDRPGPRQLVRRVGWGVADQGISSLGNFALGVVAAHSLSPAEFGAFSLAFVTFAFVLSASRGLSTDPLMVRFSGASSSAWRAAVGAASGTALAVGLVTGVVGLALCLLVPWKVGAGFVALAVGLPGILLQDSYRFAFFSCGRGDRAFVNDLVWTLMQCAALGALLVTDRASVLTCLLAFSLTATAAAGLGWLQTGISPRIGMARGWLVEHRALAGRYLAENLSIGTARQLKFLVVGVVAGLAAVGLIRAAEILMGPFMIVLAGIAQVSVPEAKHVLERTPRDLPRFCTLLASGQAVAALLWGAAVVVLPVGPLVLGDLWDPARPLVLPILVILVLGCFETSAASGLRAMGASKRSLAAQLSSAALYLAGGASGAVLGGATGSCWGVVLSQVLGLVVWRRQLRLGIAEHVAAHERTDVRDDQIRFRRS